MRGILVRYHRSLCTIIIRILFQVHCVPKISLLIAVLWGIIMNLASRIFVFGFVTFPVFSCSATNLGHPPSHAYMTHVGVFEAGATIITPGYFTCYAV